MPIIKARTNRVRMVRYIYRLQEPNRDTLKVYARFIGATADYVLNQLVASTIGKDRDFPASVRRREWRVRRVEQARSHGCGLPRPGSPALSRALMRARIDTRRVLSLTMAGIVGVIGSPRVDVAEAGPRSLG